MKTNFFSTTRRKLFPIIGTLGLAIFQSLEATASDRVLVDVATNRWTAMEGSLPARTAAMDGRNVVLMPCAFATNAGERASWDLRTTLDLSAARCFQFDIFCTNTAPVSEFVVYFESGRGWYRSEFFPDSLDGWSTITVEKNRASIEGTPGGWDKIRTIRVSAWRGQNRDTEFYLGNFVAADAPEKPAMIAIIRGDSVAKRSPDEARSVAQFSAGIAEQFRALGMDCQIISDNDVSAEKLRPFKLAVLPHNPNIPDAVADELFRFAQQGGRLMTFYNISGKLCDALGFEDGGYVKEKYSGYFSSIHFAGNSLDGAPSLVGQQSWNIRDLKAVPGKSRVLADWLDDKGKPTGHTAVIASSNGIAMTHVLLDDDIANKRLMLLAMAESLVPEIGKSAADAALARIATENGFKNFDDAAAKIAAVGGDASRAKAARDEAIAAAKEKHFSVAIAKAAATSRALLAAWCAAQKPEAGEFRAFWCHDAFGVSGISWDEAIARLATNGFTAIFPNMLWGGAAFYNSDVLPVADRAKEHGDQIAACVAACKKYGVQIHVWKVNWNLGNAVPKDFVERMRKENRLQKNARGEELEWLCPSHPENQKLETAAMVEVAKKYDVDGIHFDYIRYPDGDHCFCDGCRERFEAAIGSKIANWPRDVLRDGDLRNRWLDWRRGNITAVVKATSEQARAIKPKIKISAAVFRNWSTDRDAVGQDWKLWCDKGWMDFVCPMDYTASNHKFENEVVSQIEWAGTKPCYPGIGVSASSSHFGPERVIEQIEIARKHHTGGFIIFNYGVAESRDLIPLLGLGITWKR